MNNDERLLQVLKTIRPNHYRILGENRAEELSARISSGELLESLISKPGVGGSAMDFMFSLKTAAEILTVAKLSFDIAANWKKNGWGIPGIKAVSEELQKRDDILSALSAGVKAELNHIIETALKNIAKEES